MKTQLTIAVLATLSLPLHAEINISGFASVNGGKVISGTGVPQYDVEPTFLADYPIVSAYTQDFSMKPESLFGLQFTGNLSEGLFATAQIVARGANDYDAKFEWAYISYELNDSLTIQAGKKDYHCFTTQIFLMLVTLMFGCAHQQIIIHGKSLIITV